MKQIAKNIVNGISNIENYIFNTDQEKMITELFENYMTNIKSNYWYNLVVLDQNYKSFGVEFGYWDIPFSEEQRYEIKEGRYLVESLPLLLEFVHLNDFQRNATILNYTENNNLHIHTHISLEYLFEFIYNLLYYKCKEKAFNRIKNKWVKFDSNFALDKISKADFLTFDFKESEHPADILAIVLQCFMKNTDTISAVDYALTKYKNIHPYSLLLLAALGNLFYSDMNDLEIVKRENKTEELELLYKLSYDDFEFPKFENPIKKYTINEINRLRYIAEGQDPQTYFFDPTLEIYLEDEDQAHDEDYAFTLLLAEIAYGIKQGYIENNSHVLDLHKYYFNPDFMKHAENHLDDGGFLEAYGIEFLRANHNIDLMFPYIK